MTKVVIIGAGAAGTTAGLWAKKTDRKCEVVIITREPYPEYSRCGLPYTISKVIPEFTNLMEHEPAWYENFAKIDLRLETEVIDIDSKAKTVKIKNIKTGEEETINYDKLVIATGSHPAAPPIEGAKEKKGVYFLRTIQDAMDIEAAAQKAKTAVVIGAGLIGVEAAENLVEKGLKVAIVEFLPSLVPLMIDPDMAELVEEEMVKHGIEVYTNTAAKAILGDEKAEKVLIENRETQETKEIPADMVLIGAGVRPYTDIAQKAGAELGTTKYIKVNEKCETSVPDVYSAGDCTEYPDFVTGEAVPQGMGTIAVRMGKVCGINAVGGEAKMPPGVLLTRITKIFDIQIAAVGPTIHQLERSGIKPVIGKITGSSKPEYFPGGKLIRIKILSDGKGKILGAQIVGYEDVHQKINVIAAAMQSGMSVYELEWLETCYAPASCPTWDVLTLVAEPVIKKIKRKK
ncbi:MAG: FAD-dependent oxidoreductase [Candidatus Lokiarchaeia archaeon]